MSAEKELVVNSLQEIKGSVELFYQQRTGEALQQFNLTLGKITTLVDTLFAYQAEHGNLGLEEDKIKNVLTEAMRALEEGDMILLADIIQYDFVEYVEKMISHME